MDILYAVLLIFVILLQMVILMKDSGFNKPFVLMSEGRLNGKNMKKCRVTTSDLIAAARLGGYFNLADIDTAIMEKNGKISLLPAAQKRRLEPKDFNFSPVRDGVGYPVYQNGRLCEDYLRAVGFTEQSLSSFLDERGYTLSAVELIIVNENGRVCVFPKEN